jgi:hypothetical protein
MKETVDGGVFFSKVTTEDGDDIFPAKRGRGRKRK